MKKLTIFLISLLAFNFLFADIISDKNFNFTLDIPEGFNVKDANEASYSYHFEHPNIPVQFILKIYEKENSSSFSILEEAMSKLKAKASFDRVLWEGNDCTVSQFDMNLGKDYSGWACSAPLEVKDSYITVITYADKDKAPACQQFMISLLNSLTVSDITCQNPGLFMAYAFPKEGDKTVNLNIGGKKITSKIDKTDEEASQFLVDLEFGVLSLYASHPMWKEAWQRYYRLIFRDNYGRLSRVSEDIFARLYPECEKKRKDDPNTEYVSRLLSWVQDFKYERHQTKASSDLTPPVMAVCGDGNDCDSRSLLMCCIMQRAGIDSILLISREYSHALCAFDIMGQGQTFETSYGSYLMCETTAKVTPGMIAQEQADRSKWIVVD